MNIDRLAAFALVALATACAAEPGLEPRHAEVTLTSAQQAAPTAKAATGGTTTEQLADLVGRYRDPRVPARLTPKAAPAEADDNPDLVREEPKKDEAYNATAALPKERTAIAVDARARLAKADAHVTEARNRSARLPDDRRAKFTASYNLFTAKKSEVQSHISSLAYGTGSAHNDAKARLERSLNDLEALAGRVD